MIDWKYYRGHYYHMLEFSQRALSSHTGTVTEGIISTDWNYHRGHYYHILELSQRALL
jgi:hypothetical protein